MSDSHARPSNDGQSTGQPAGQIDMRKLADKVYRLMLADIRLERARGVQPAKKDR